MLEHSPVYVPLLKWKNGEQKAVKELAASVKRKIYPLCILAPIPWDFDADDYKCSIDQHVANIGENLHNIWDSDLPIMVDGEQLDGELLCNGMHPMQRILMDAEALGVQIVPVVGTDKSIDYFKAVKWATAKYNRGIAIRIRPIDFSNVDQILLSIMKDFGIHESIIDLIIDCEEVGQNQEHLIASAVSSLLKQLNAVNAYRKVVVTAASFPKSLAGINNYSVNEYERIELKIWQSLKKVPELTSLNIVFGDYTIDDPYWPDRIDPRFLVRTMIGNIRYTHTEKWFVAKGEKLHSPIGYRQFFKVAALLTNHPKKIFSGSNYSAGDKKILDCATKATSSGNTGTWIQAAVNHHITFVASQVSAILGRP